MLSRLLALGWCAMLFPMVSALAETKDWPQWRGPERDGKSASTGINTDWESKPPKLLWMAEGLGKGYASVSIADDTLYTTGNFSEFGQAVVAMDLKEKKVLWQQLITDAIPKHGYEGSRCTPTIDGDRLYVVMSDGTVACLKRAGGEILWKRSLQEDWDGNKPQWGFAESPLVDGDNVIVAPGSKGSLLVALDKMTGDQEWVTEADVDLGARGKDEAGYSSTLIGNGLGVKQYVKLIGRGVIGVDAESGKLLWHYNGIANDVANIPDPIIDGDHIFTSTGYQTGAALLQLKRDGDGMKAEEVYFIAPNIFQNHHGGMVKVGDVIYAGTKHGQGFPTCIDMKSGKILWGGDIRGVGKGSAALMYVDGHLIFRYESGELALVEATPEEYRLKGSLKPEYQEDKSWAHPVVLDGLLYLREQDKLMCYDLRK